MNRNYLDLILLQVIVLYIGTIIYICDMVLYIYIYIYIMKIYIILIITEENYVIYWMLNWISYKKISFCIYLFFYLSLSY